MSACAFPGCVNGADPRWGGYCDGHGATTEREAENRHSAIVALATEAVELRAQVAALRKQRVTLREALGGMLGLVVGTSAEDESPFADARAALDATKEEP